MLLRRATGKCHTNTRCTMHDSTSVGTAALQLRSTTVARITSPESLSEIRTVTRPCRAGLAPSPYWVKHAVMDDWRRWASVANSSSDTPPSASAAKSASTGATAGTEGADGADACAACTSGADGAGGITGVVVATMATVEDCGADRTGIVVVRAVGGATCVSVAA